MTGSQIKKVFAPRDKEWIRQYHDAADLILNHGCESHIKIATGAGSVHLETLPKNFGRDPNVIDVNGSSDCQDSRALQFC